MPMLNSFKFKFLFKSYNSWKKGFGSEKIKHTEEFFFSMISIPFWEGLVKEDIDKIILGIRNTIKELKS